MPLSDSEYLIHGTQDENAIRILKKKTISANPPKKYKAMLSEWPETKQIFTQLIYKDIPNQQYNNPGWGSIKFILSKQILKDYPFYATHIGHFFNNFNDAFEPNNKDIIIKSPKGNLARMPNLTKLRNHIKTGRDFMHSHEILFNRDIPLEKYCLVVIANKYTKDDENNELNKLCNQLNIPYHRMEKDNKRCIPIGLNNFIDLIDKIIK
jgi:hypothetical protein